MSNTAESIPVLKLKVKNDDLQCQLFLVTGDNLFGRHPKCNLNISYSSVSQKHCQLIVNPNNISVLEIVDLGSKNGVFVNNQRVQVNKKIKFSLEKDKLEIADLECEFEVLANQKKQLKKQGVEQKINKEKPQRKKNRITQQQEQKKQGSQANKLRKKQSFKEGSISGESEQQSVKYDQKNPTRSKAHLKYLDEVQQKGEQRQSKRKVSKTLSNISKIDPSKDKINQQTKSNKLKIRGNKTEPTTDNYEASDDDAQGSHKRQTKNTKASKEKGIDRIEIKSKEQKKVQNRKDKTINTINAVPIEKSVSKKALKSFDTTLKLEQKLKILKPPSKTILLHYGKTRPCILLLSSFKTPPSLPKYFQQVESYKQKFDVLVMPSFIRTYKLLFALCQGKPIISQDWLKACSKAQQIISYEGYELKVGDEPNDIISQSLQKVRQGHKIFNNIQVCMLGSEDNFHLKIKEVADLVIIAGGSIIGSRRVEYPKQNLYMIVPIEHEPLKKDIQRKIKEGYNVNTIEFITRSCLTQSLCIKETSVNL